MRTNTKLSIEQYFTAVERIANGFFAEDGSYAPHAGRINAMAVFLDVCVEESKWDGIESPDANEVLSDEEFVDAYNRALKDDYSYGMTFCNAYHDALSIVDKRNGSIMQIATLVNSFVSEFFTPDNIAKLFGSSERFKDIVENTPENVVSLFEKTTK